jgi:hypothetical protein
MTVWTLAASGEHGLLRLGQSLGEVVDSFGPPTHAHGRSLLKYGDVELHFAGYALWLVHCEFGGPPLPPAVASDELTLSPDGLAWPTTSATLKQVAEAHGFAVEPFTEPWGEGLRFGLGRLVFDGDDKLVTWSVMRPER